MPCSARSGLLRQRIAETLDLLHRPYPGRIAAISASRKDTTPTIGGSEMHRFLAIAMALAVLGCWSAAGALAARNPVGSGQPGTASPGGAWCGSEGSTLMPRGFEGPGFEHATGVYAGSPGTPS